MKLFEIVDVGAEVPQQEDWYWTDKGNLYFFPEKDGLFNNWSCRDDRLSEEYPKKWFKTVEAGDDTVMDRKELIDCIHNLMALVDSPVGRRQISSTFAEEVREVGRKVMSKYGRKLTGE